MPFSSTSYDPATLSLLGSAFNDAWAEVEATTSGYSEGDINTLRKLMALNIMDAANSGERDAIRLKAQAVRVVERRDYGLTVV